MSYSDIVSVVSPIIGVAWLVVGGAVMLRATGYRITPTHLEVEGILLPIAPVDLGDIGEISVVERGHGDWSCVWFYVSHILRPWTILLYLVSTYTCINRLRGPVVLVRMTNGQTLVLTPEQPARFADELAMAVQCRRSASR
jgi:hypothetical protein